jgi:hypothetical protein
MDKSYIVICLGTAVLYIKKELLVLKYKDKSHVVICCQYIINILLLCRYCVFD